jgi:DNA adenine methylase
MNEQAAAWLSAVDGLPAVHERLIGVVITNRDALKVIDQHDSADTIFYLDPPYMPETRTAPKVYAHEMTTDQHRAMLEAVTHCKGKVILSGYPNDLYASKLRGWQCIEHKCANSAASGCRKRRMTEALWLNFAPATSVKGLAA